MAGVLHEPAGRGRDDKLDPDLLQQASGTSLAQASRIGAMFQVGGTLGAILVGG